MITISFRFIYIKDYLLINALVLIPRTHYRCTNKCEYKCIANWISIFILREIHMQQPTTGRNGVEKFSFCMANVCYRNQCEMGMQNNVRWLMEIFTYIQCRISYFLEKFSCWLLYNEYFPLSLCVCYSFTVFCCRRSFWGCIGMQCSMINISWLGLSIQLNEWIL